MARLGTGLGFKLLVLAPVVSMHSTNHNFLRIPQMDWQTEELNTSATCPSDFCICICPLTLVQKAAIYTPSLKLFHTKSCWFQRTFNKVSYLKVGV